MSKKPAVHQGRAAGSPVEPAIFYRLVAMIACVVPVATLVLSYLAIAVHTGNPLPWLEIVHESGDRTLIGTIFYFEHAARELPLDLLLGVTVGASALFVFPAGPSSIPPAARRHRILAFATISMTAIILGGTLWTGGPAMLFENLLQYPTRPGDPLQWGGHWRYHLLSQAMLILLAPGLAGMLVLSRGRAAKGYRTGITIFRGSFAIFLGLAVVFAPNLDSFRNPVFLGHQAREAFTHTLVTIPAAWGFCLRLAKRQWSTQQDGTRSVHGPVMAGVMAVCIGFFLLLGSMATSAASLGQTQSLVILIFPHFFEHTFSYLVVLLSAGLVYESVRYLNSAARSGNV